MALIVPSPAYIADLARDPLGRFGFVDRAETTLSFSDSTYTLTLSSVGATWQYMRDGRLITVAGNKTAVLSGTPPTKGTYYVIIDNDTGTLSASTGPWSLAPDATAVLVCIVEWDDTLTPKYWLADERHTCLMDRATHRHLHSTVGTRYVSGAVLTGYTASSAVDTALTFAISEAVISDEDIMITLAALSDPNGTNTDYVAWYRTGASTWAWAASAVPFRYTAAGYIQWDNAGTMTQGASGNFYNWYLVLTNYAGATRFALVPGRAQFTNTTNAYAENPQTFDWSGFPIAESVLAYQLTFETQNSYSSKGKCRLTRAPQRLSLSIATSTAQVSGSHNTLAGLQGGAPTEFYHLSEAQAAAAIAAETLIATQFGAL